MPETIGALVIDLALDASAEFLSDAAIDAGVEFATATTLGVTNATLVGSGLFLAASIGLQYALSRPAPKAEQGSQPIRQPLQPRQRGYWDNRLSGAVMLAMAGGAAPTTAVMVAAFHQGPVESLSPYVYFDDDKCTTTNDITGGGYSGSINGPGGAYADASLSINMGRPGQVADPILTASVAGGTWTADFIGTDIAYWGLQASAPADPTQFAKMFPRGLPKPSVVARCSPLWDPRDGGQDQDDASTWAASPNPVLQLLDYLRTVDGGMGFDIDEFCPPARRAQWMAEASLCEVDLGAGDIRYRSAGWYTFDTKREDVINKILAACDGWLAPAGDGSLVLTVGVYREPTLPPIEQKHILDCLVNLGNPDETLVNQLDCGWTNPDENYATDQAEPIQDADSISLVGEIKRQPLDLSWVQWLPQVVRLGERALRRINPDRSGTIVTTLYGLRYVGERWVRLQFPPFPGLEDCVIEIQDLQADILGGRVTIKFITVDPLIIAGTGF